MHGEADIPVPLYWKWEAWGYSKWRTTQILATLPWIHWNSIFMQWNEAWNVLIVEYSLGRKMAFNSSNFYPTHTSFCSHLQENTQETKESLWRMVLAQLQYNVLPAWGPKCVLFVSGGTHSSCNKCQVMIQHETNQAVLTWRFPSKKGNYYLFSNIVYYSHT